MQTQPLLKHLTIGCCMLALGACTPQNTTQKKQKQTTTPSSQGANVREPEDILKTHKTFQSYWYQGLAELTRYKLTQSRYGELRDGEAVLVYVTEDFLKDKQVKYEFGDKAQAIKVLKLNATRTFNTGIYPYTIMSSSFVPIQAKRPLKISATVQEWCGQTFMQLNHRNGQYDVALHSYFQSEGDQNTKITSAISEDSLWNQVRHNPKTLPTGELNILPPLRTLRLQHKEAKNYAATATLKIIDTSDFSNKKQFVYQIHYKDYPRQVHLYVEHAFPHRILGWQESIATKLVAGKKLQSNDVTTGTLTRSLMLDYWSKNRKKDAPLRKTLRTPK